ncbi:retrovirus-related pol polyprotein from transposon TNT 1-94 [Tanacetum coccineum]
MPPKLDLSFSGLEEFVNEPTVSKPTVKMPVVETSEAKASADKPKVVSITHPSPKRNMVPKAVLMRSGLVSLTTGEAKASANKPKDKNVNAARPKAVVNAARPKAVVNAVKGNNVNVVKASTCWVWKPKTKVLDHGTCPILLTLKKLMKDMLPLEVTLKEGKSQAEVQSKLLTDESHVLLKVPRENNMYSVDLKNIVPKGGERKNRTLIEADRTMLADSKLPTTFWAKAINTACYVQNSVLVTKPHNKTPYEHFLGKKPALGFMRPFGCPVTILNTIDHLGKFDGKADEGFFVGYSINSKAFRVFNSRTRIVEENLHVQFSKDTPNITANPPFSQSSKSSQDDGSKPLINDKKKVDEDPRKDSESIDQEKDDNVNNTNNVNAASINEVNDLVENKH